MPKGDDLQDRLIKFAARIIRVSAALPKDTAGRHIANQILRSGTAPAAHHAEARAAESPADFVHKMKIGAKELNETEVWLRITIASELLTGKMLAGVLQECNELQRIFATSIKTARKSQPRR